MDEIPLGSYRPDLRVEYLGACKKRSGVFACTRISDHTGPHTTVSTLDLVIHVWRNTPQVTPEVTPEVLRAVANHLNSRRLPMDAVNLLLAEAAEMETPGRRLHDALRKYNLVGARWDAVGEKDQERYEAAAKEER